MYMNHVCLFDVVDNRDGPTSDLFTKALSYALSKVGKAGIVLKWEQLQAVCHINLRRSSLAQALLW